VTSSVLTPWIDREIVERIAGQIDVTATIQSLPLMTASIMSKKLAEGTDGLVPDVKVGRGAFMTTEAEARQLAHAMVKAGQLAGVKTEALLTRMDAPLGRAVGNALEVVESIETLRGHAKDDAGARDKFLGIMLAQAERMSRLIDDLMSLSRIELNEHIAPLGRVDLAMATIDVIDALAPQAKEKAVSFDPVLPPRGAAVVEGDRDQIIQVIQNLVDNAIKYTPRDGVVRVEIYPGLSADAAATPRDPAAARMSLLTPDHAAGERYAALRVTDRGPGLAREHLPRLTERFYRVEGQKSGDRSGTGLGLAIVKHIMNRHRGGLTVESMLGEGATFGVYFPMAKAGAARGVAAEAQA